MMKINELTIGDIVFHEKHGNVIVECVDNDFGDNPGLCVKSKNIKHKDGYEYGLCWCDLDEVFPLPLTKEILEENGFKHGYGDSDYYEYEKFEKEVGDKVVCVIKDNNGWFARVDDKLLTHSMGKSEYIHFLQHVIRHGGIDNELIKV